MLVIYESLGCVAVAVVGRVVISDVNMVIIGLVTVDVLEPECPVALELVSRRALDVRFYERGVAEGVVGGCRGGCGVCFSFSDECLELEGLLVVSSPEVGFVGLLAVSQALVGGVEDRGRGVESGL